MYNEPARRARLRTRNWEAVFTAYLRVGVDVLRYASPDHPENVVIPGAQFTGKPGINLGGGASIPVGHPS
jgi:hypothetical protein